MNKSDSATTCSEPRNLVHQAIPGRSTRAQRRVQIRHSIADVVDTRPSPGEKLPDRAVRREWREQLYLGLTEWERYNAGAIGGLRRVGGNAEDVAIKSQRGLQIGYGNAHMGNAGDVGQTSLHGS